MLINRSKLLGYPILSLHVGGAIAQVTSEIVDPNNLKIIAFTLRGPEVSGETGDILETRSIREFAPGMGMIIDSSDEFVFQEDVIRLDEIMKLNFALTGLKVETKKRAKLGKVVDFVINTDDFEVVQLIIKRPAIKSLIDSELVISTADIVEITDYKIIVKDETEKTGSARESGEFMPNFVNPFREQPSYSPTSSQTPGEPSTE